jgi:hypothetical protein
VWTAAKLGTAQIPFWLDSMQPHALGGHDVQSKNRTHIAGARHT